MEREGKAQVAIEPMLSVRGGSRAMEFYKEALGAVETYRIADPDGNVVGRLSIEGAEFWIHDESASSPGPQTLGGSGFRLVLIVPDPDALHARALAAGAVAMGAVVEEHGWRTGRIVDPFGHHWEISRPLG